MSESMKVIIGSDGSGYPLKKEVVKALRADGYIVEDVGCFNEQGFYIDAAEPVCKGVQSGNFSRGILICGTGQGMVITANKFSGIRAALCYNQFTAKMSRADNNANVLCTGGWMLKVDDAVKMIEIWLMSDYYDTNIYGLKRITEFEMSQKNEA